MAASAPGRKWPYWPNPLGTTAPRITIKRPRPASSTIAGCIRCPESRMNFCTQTPPVARNAYVGAQHEGDQTALWAEIGRSGGVGRHDFAQKPVGILASRPEGRLWRSYRGCGGLPGDVT